MSEIQNVSPLCLTQGEAAKRVGCCDRVFRNSEKALIACGMKIVKFPGRGKKPCKKYLASSIDFAVERAADRGIQLG
jgi:hypothetical protein